LSIITNIIGQQKLKNYFSRLTFLEIPHSLLFIGEEGCGKKFFVENLSSTYYGVAFKNITAQIDGEFILNTYTETKPLIYLIELDKVDVKKQNVILKFIEEPPLYAKVILTTSRLNQIIPTLVNRCQCFTFEPYSLEELRVFSKDDELLVYCSTPGQILSYTGINIKDIANYCLKIVEKISSSNKGNLFAISDKIAFKDEKEKYNIDLFIKVLMQKFRDACVYDISKSKSYRLIADYDVLRKQNASFNQRALFETLLLDLSEVS
jgi:replication-associated recombination protein RarA